VVQDVHGVTGPGDGEDKVGSQPQTQEQQTPINLSGHGVGAAGRRSHLAPSAATDIQPKTGGNEAHQEMWSRIRQVPSIRASGVVPEPRRCQVRQDLTKCPS